MADANEWENTADMVSKAIQRAFQLGQVYWKQAESESYSQNKKADDTQAKLDALIDEVRATLCSIDNAHMKTGNVAKKELADSPPKQPACCVCGTTVDVKWIGGSSPWKCPSLDCVAF